MSRCGQPTRIARWQASAGRSGRELQLRRRNVVLRRPLVLLLMVVERLPLQCTDSWGRGLALHAMLDLHGCAVAVLNNVHHFRGGRYGAGGGMGMDLGGRPRDHGQVKVLIPGGRARHLRRRRGGERGQPRRRLGAMKILCSTHCLVKQW